MYVAPRFIIDLILICRALREETLVPVDQFEVVRSRTHGDGQAVLTAMDRLKVSRLLSTRHEPEAELVSPMIAARIIAPHTKLATTRWWQTHTVAEHFGVGEASEDDLYAAMDWLLDRQAHIEELSAESSMALLHHHTSHAASVASSLGGETMDVPASDRSAGPPT